MNIFKRLKLDSVIGKKSSIKKVSKTKKTILVKTIKVPKEINVKNVSEELGFWVNNGPVLRSLSDLCDALSWMTDEQFNYHTKKNVNDFAKWVEEVLEEKSLAKKIARSEDRDKMIAIIKSFLQ